MQSMPQKYTYILYLAIAITKDNFAMIGVVCTVVVWLAMTLHWNHWHSLRDLPRQPEKWQEITIRLQFHWFTTWTVRNLGHFSHCWSNNSFKMLNCNCTSIFCKFYLRNYRKKKMQEDASSRCWGYEWAFLPFF